jgi:hypothetical protein
LEETDDPSLADDELVRWQNEIAAKERKDRKEFTQRFQTPSKAQVLRYF